MLCHAKPVTIKNNIEGLHITQVKNTDSLDTHSIQLRLSNTSGEALDFVLVLPFLYEYRVTFSDASNDKNETYNWGMEASKSSINPSFPSMNIFLQERKVFNLTIHAQAIIRPNGKLFIEAFRTNTYAEFSFAKKLFDAIMAAFLLVNIFFFIRWNRSKSNTQEYRQFYLAYSICLFLFFFFRTFLLYFNSFQLPAWLIVVTEVLGFLGGVLYYNFGLSFMLSSTSKLKYRLQIIIFFAALVYLVALLIERSIHLPSLAYVRFGLFGYLFISMITIGLVTIRYKRSKIFLTLFVPFLLLVFMGFIQKNNPEIITTSVYSSSIILGLAVLDITFWLFMLKPQHSFLPTPKLTMDE